MPSLTPSQWGGQGDLSQHAKGRSHSRGSIRCSVATRPFSLLCSLDAAALLQLKVSCLSAAATAAAESLQLCPTLCDPMDCSPPGSPSLGLSRQEHWDGLPLPSPVYDPISLGCPHSRLWMDRSGFCACGISRLLALQLHVWEIRGRKETQRTHSHVVPWVPVFSAALLSFLHLSESSSVCFINSILSFQGKIRLHIILDILEIAIPDSFCSLILEVAFCCLILFCYSEESHS